MNKKLNLIVAANQTQLAVNDCFFIYWHFPKDEDAIGGALGSYVPSQKERQQPTREDQEMIFAFDFIQAWQKVFRNPDDVGHHINGFWFKRECDAKACKTALLKAWKNNKLPRIEEEWETKALQAGWKPPKGWNDGFQ